MIFSRFPDETVEIASAKGRRFGYHMSESGINKFDDL